MELEFTYFLFLGAVVGNRSLIDDRIDLDASSDDRAERIVTAGSDTLHDDMGPLETVEPGGFLEALLHRHRRRIRSRFASTLESCASAAVPGEDVALWIRDADMRVVVERGDADDALFDDAFRFLVSAECLSHSGKIYWDGLLSDDLLVGDGGLFASFGAGVGLRALATDRQVLLVTDASVAVDVLEGLDVAGHLSSEVSLERVVLQLVSDDAELLLGERLDLAVGLDLRRGEDSLGSGRADTVDRGESDPEVLVVGDVYSRDAYHKKRKREIEISLDADYIVGSSC